MKCGSPSAGRIYKQYHYNMSGLLLFKSAPIEGIQAGAALSEAQSHIHTSDHCGHPLVTGIPSLEKLFGAT